jgi:hypothetical protein
MNKRTAEQRNWSIHCRTATWQGQHLMLSITKHSLERTRTSQDFQGSNLHAPSECDLMAPVAVTKKKPTRLSLVEWRRWVTHNCGGLGGFLPTFSPDRTVASRVVSTSGAFGASSSTPLPPISASGGTTPRLRHFRLIRSYADGAHPRRGVRVTRGLIAP